MRSKLPQERRQVKDTTRKRRGPYRIIPDAVLFDRRLACLDRLVYAALVKCDDNLNTSPSVAAIADLVGRCRSQIKPALRRLEECGHIARVRRGFLATQYDLVASYEPENRPTCGPENRPTCGPENRPTCGPENRPTCGPENRPLREIRENKRERGTVHVPVRDAVLSGLEERKERKKREGGSSSGAEKYVQSAHPDPDASGTVSRSDSAMLSTYGTGATPQKTPPRDPDLIAQMIEQIDLEPLYDEFGPQGVDVDGQYELFRYTCIHGNGQRPFANPYDYMDFTQGFVGWLVRKAAD